MHSKPPFHSGSDEWAQSALKLLNKAEADQYQTDSTGVRILELPAEEGMAGNNGKIVFRQFELDSYNGPKEEDFIRLAHSYFRAAKKELERLDNDTTAYLLDSLMQEFIEQMNSLGKDQPASDGISKGFPVGPGKFALKIKPAGKLIQQLNINFAAVLLHAEGHQKIDDANLIKKGKMLRKLVQKQIEHDRRANSIHLYKIPDPHNSGAPIERSSTVTTIGKSTVPSSIRTGDYKKQGTAISNFVRRTYGSVTRDITTGEPTISTEFTGLTHSSYPPVDLFMRTGWKTFPKPINSFLNKWETKIFGVSLDAEIQIRERAIKGVEQVLLEFAQEEMAKGNVTQPITLNLTTLSLVTPILTKLVERQIRPSISESKQLEEVMLALSMCRGRKELFVTGPDGNPIQIKIDMTHINMPTNLGTRFKPYKTADLNPAQQYSHARGFFDYCTNVSQFLAEPKNTSIDMQGLSFSAVGKCLTPSISFGLIAREQAQRLKIDMKYQDLYHLQVTLQQDPSDQAKRKEYLQCLNDIKSLENEHQKICFQLTKLHKENFNKNKEQAQQELVKAEIITKNLPKDHPLKVYVDNCRLMFNTQKIYHEGTYKNPKNAYDFQALYLLSNQRMGRKVEWFCKSAEDRAGRVGEKVEELLSFHNIHGCFPSTKRDQLVINEFISPKVHDGSISKQVTDDNDPGARGLQVGSAFGNKHLLLSDIDKKMSQLAKNVYVFKVSFMNRLVFFRDWIHPSKKVLTALKSPGSSTLHFDALSSATAIPKGKSKADLLLDKIGAEIEKWEKLGQQGFKLLSTLEEQEKIIALQQMSLLHQKLQDPNVSPKERVKLLQKADIHFVKLISLYPGSQAAQVQDNLNFRYLSKTKKYQKFSCHCDTSQDYETLAKQSEQEFKKLAKGAAFIKDKATTAQQELFKGVLYKSTSTRNVEISIPPDQLIKRNYLPKEKKVEIQMNSSSDRAIFIGLQAGKKFGIINIELPKSGNIEAHHVNFVVNTLLAAKLSGIPAKYDLKYDEILKKDEFKNQRILIDNIQQTSTSELLAFSKGKSTLSDLAKSLLEAVTPKEKQNLNI